MSPDPFPTSPALQDCRVGFGGDTTRVEPDGPLLRLAVPLLGGPPDELILAGADEVSAAGEWTLFRSPGRLAGFATARAAEELEAAASTLYRQLFDVSEGFHLHRIWNYVPRINDAAAGLESYRRFCRGRSLAFERRFGASFKRLLPAASAVGTKAGPLALAFIAGEAAPRHFENPLQVPAFEYPPLYGPRPPSFARATLVDDAIGSHLFVSGTAAIRGSETVAAGDLDRQIGCTIENIKSITRTSGIPNALRDPGWTRSFKVYVRHGSDLPRVLSRTAGELIQPGDTVHCLESDICRAELLVEIEAILTQRQS